MIFKKGSVFYINARKRIEEYVANGGNVDEIERSHPIYKYILGSKLTDENKKRLTIEQIFDLLGYPRKSQKRTIETGIKKSLDEFVEAGGNVDDLKRSDPLYMYIKDTKMYDENKKLLGLEEKFKILGYPRNLKCSKDVKADLVKEINEYINAGGSFHIERKKLPFYGKLSTYSNLLKRKGINLTHDEIMKSLGYKNFSDDYYRCLNLFKLKSYRDQDGYVDAFRENKVLQNAVKDIAIKYDIPYYLVITLLCDEKLKRCSVQINRIKQTENDLKRYIEENGTLVGIRRKDKNLFNSLEYITMYYSDGSGEVFSKQEWLDIFGLGDVENRFREKEKSEIDIETIMIDLKNRKKESVKASDFDIHDYRLIVKKAVQMGASIKDVCSLYGIKYEGLEIERLSRKYVEKIPFLKEMKARRDELIEDGGISLENGYCKEEVFENRLKITKQVYNEFKNRHKFFASEGKESFDEEILEK